MQYRAEIDGLRAVAVIPVILFHAGFSAFQGGFVGVDVFFVISGYLITSIIVQERAAGSFSLIGFYERRARRILPALFLVMAVSVALAWLCLLPSDMADFARSVSAVPIFSSNILFWLGSGYFDTAAELKPLLHTWSLAIEEQYYLLFPIVMVLFWRPGRCAMAVGLALVAIGSFMFAQWGSAHAPAAAFFLLPARAWELLAGALVALHLYRRAAGESADTCSNVAKGDGALGLLGLLMIVVAVFAFDARTPYPSSFTLLPTVGTALIIVYAVPGSLACQLLSMRSVVGIGLISYSAYLWHQPLFAFARHQDLVAASGVTMLVLAAASVVLAFLSWRYVERPFRNRVIVGRRGLLRFATLGSCLFVVLGVYGATTHGNVGGLASGEAAASRQAAIDALNAERLRLIRSGICHFNARGPHGEIDDFIASWNCKPDFARSPAAPRIAVYGDSHSADKAVALRLNGFDVLQLGGAACPLLPTQPQADICNRTLERFRVALDENNVGVVLLANRFEPEERRPEYLARLFDYWSGDRTVVLFSPMPEFPVWNVRYERHGRADFRIDLTAYREFYAALEKVTIPPNFLIVDTMALFCGNGMNCPGRDAAGQFLLVDYGHLSRRGAEIFGARLLALREFRALSEAVSSDRLAIVPAGRADSVVVPVAIERSTN